MKIANFIKIFVNAKNAKNAKKLPFFAFWGQKNGSKNKFWKFSWITFLRNHTNLPFTNFQAISMKIAYFIKIFVFSLTWFYIILAEIVFFYKNLNKICNSYWNQLKIGNMQVCVVPQKCYWGKFPKIIFRPIFWPQNVKKAIFLAFLAFFAFF